MPAYKPLSVCGYHIREAGSTAAQELAFTLADGFGYVELGPRAASTSTCSRPACRSSSTPTSTSSRRSRSSAPLAGSGLAGCATSTARRPTKAQWLRFHTQTAGVSLTAQQPYNNVVRTASRRSRPCSAAPTRCTPTPSTRPSRCRASEAAEIALRTQQVIMEETGVINVADPLGGSWYVEALTDRIEAEAEAIFAADQSRWAATAASPRGSCAASRTAGSRPRSPRRPSRTSRPWRRATSRSSASTATPTRSRRDLEILRVSHEVETEQVPGCRVADVTATTRRSPRHSTTCARRQAARPRRSRRCWTLPGRGDARRDLRRPARRVGRVPEPARF